MTQLPRLFLFYKTRVYLCTVIPSTALLLFNACPVNYKQASERQLGDFAIISTTGKSNSAKLSC